MPQITDALAREANRLYWETEISVADIATQLELSRRALYDAVTPLLTGNPCAICGAVLVFENRSARNAREETCIDCVTRDEQDQDEPQQEERGAAGGRAAAGVPAGLTLGDEPGVQAERALRVGGAALAGAALGAIATMFLVPRR